MDGDPRASEVELFESFKGSRRVQRVASSQKNALADKQQNETREQYAARLAEQLKRFTRPKREPEPDFVDRPFGRVWRKDRLPVADE